jgi:hypothetical protein
MRSAKYTRVRSPRRGQIIKTQLRKLDNDTVTNIQKVGGKFKAGMKKTEDELYEKIDGVEAHLRGEIILVQKTIARNRSDFDRKYDDLCSTMSALNEEQIQHNEYFNTLSTLCAYLIENINMQMESETADLLDKRMM